MKLKFFAGLAMIYPLSQDAIFFAGCFCGFFLRWSHILEIGKNDFFENPRNFHIFPRPLKKLNLP